MDFFNRNDLGIEDNSSFQNRCHEAKVKENNEMKKRLLVVGVIWFVIIAYLICPLSKARINKEPETLVMLTKEDIYSIGNFSKNTFIWNVNKSEIEENLKQYDYISEAKVSLTPFGVKIKVEEISVVAKTGNVCTTYGSECTYYLSNNQSVNGLNDYKTINVKHIASFGDVPTISNVNKLTDNQKEILFNELGKVPKNIRNAMNSITLDETVTSSCVVDIIFNKADLGLSHDLKLKVDITNISTKFSKENMDYIISQVEGKNNAIKDGKYCYIYRSNDYMLPCEG